MKNLKDKGWVRIWRKIEDNPLWFLEPFTKAQAWIDLFLNANHKDGFINIRGNIIPIKRGQIGWSELTMCKRWGWSKNKVRRFLKYLEENEQISQNYKKNDTAEKTIDTSIQTIDLGSKQDLSEISKNHAKTKQQTIQQKSTVTTIITIKMYEEYQVNDTADDTAERQQKDSRRYTNNNDNNDNNDNNIYNAGKQRSSSKRLSLEKQTCLHRLVYHLEDTLKAPIINWGKQAKALSSMLKAGYTEEQIVKTITYMATKDDFFKDKGFDLMTVANTIGRYKAEAQKRKGVSNEKQIR